MPQSHCGSVVNQSFSNMDACLLELGKNSASHDHTHGSCRVSAALMKGRHSSVNTLRLARRAAADAREPHGNLRVRGTAWLERQAVVKPFPTYERWTPRSRMYRRDSGPDAGAGAYPCGRLVLHARIGASAGFPAVSNRRDLVSLSVLRGNAPSTQRQMARDPSPIVREQGLRAAHLAAPPHVIGLVQVVRGSGTTGRDAPAPA